MANPVTRAKLKYNRGAYRRYEFNLGVDSKLNALVERYKSYPDSNLSSLIKTLLCGYFGISNHDAGSIYPEYRFTKDGMVRNTELDRYFDKPPSENKD
jgi:hypothetical protein